MTGQLLEVFRGLPSQEKVVRLFLKYGIRVDGGKARCGDIELGDTAIARAAGVDRRVVRSTILKIESEPSLRSVFSKLQPTSLFTEAAPALGWSSIEIIPVDAHMPGILADVAGVMARAGISIRQAMVDDPEMSEEPRFYVITESPVPPELLPKIKECRGVRSILIH